MVAHITCNREVVYNRTIQHFHVSAKDVMDKKFDLKDAINEFLVHYNGRAYSTTRYAPKEVMESS